MLVLAPIGMMALVGQLDLASADTITVGAKVPASIPSGTPTIDSPQDGATIHTGQLTVSGTCPISDPAVIIAIYDSGTFIGSSSCDTNGNYSVEVTLGYGPHTLIATVVTVTNDVGQSSSPVTVTYPQPPQPPQPSPSTTPEKPSEVLPPSTPVPEVPPLAPVPRIIPAQTFVSIASNGKVTWSGKVEGGTPPYNLRADWGDGSADQRAVHDHSLQTFTHTYKTSHVYALLIKATDAKGITTVLQSAAVTTEVQQRVVDKAKYNDIPPFIAFVSKNAGYISIGLLSGLVFLWYLEHGHKLLLGKHRLRPRH